VLLPVLAGAMVCGALLTHAWWLWLVGSGALVTAFLMRRLDVGASWAGPVAAIAVLPLMAGYAAWRHVPLPVDRWEPWLGERIQVIGRVESAKGEPGRVRAMVTVERGWRPQRLAVEGTVAAQWPALQPPPVGTRWLLDGVIARPKTALLPGLFDRAAWLERQGVPVEMRVGHWAPLASEISWLERQRLRLVPIFTQGSDGDVGPLAASLVFGVASTPLSPELLQLFRSLNLTHLIAASGMQLVLLTAACLALTRRWHPRVGIAVSVPVLAAYVLMTGAPPSILRAAGVTGLGLIGRWFDRPTHAVRALLVTVIGLLLWDPGMIRELGFAFSVLATGGLLVTAPILEGAWAKKWPTSPTWLSTALITPIAAQVWVMPLQLHTFGQVSWMSLPANLVSGFLVDALTKTGFLAALLGLIWDPLALPLTFLIGWFVRAWLWVLGWMPLVPGQSMTVVRPDLWMMTALYAILVLWHVPHPERSQQKPWAKVAAWSLVNACLITAVWPRSDAMTVTFLPVGIGSATHVAVPGGGDWIVDTGPASFVGGEPWDAGRYRIAPYLQASGIGALAGVIVTNGRSHHAGGLGGLLASVKTAGVWDTAGAEPKYLLEPAQLALAKGIPWHGLSTPGWTWRSGARLQAWRHERRDGIHAGSLHWQWGKTAILMPGDIDREIAGAVAWPLAQILVLPDHGKDEACPEDLLDRVSPDWVVLEGASARWNRPKATLRQRLQDRGIQLWDTGKDGPLRLASDGRNWAMFKGTPSDWRRVSAGSNQ
jgi:competence protein ComEC